MRLALPIFAAGCAAAPDDEAFGLIGEVADQTENGSSIGLWLVSSPPPAYYFKLGDGSTAGNQFGLAFPTDPPADAINDDGIGVALVGLLPGIATIGDGVVELSQLRLIGLTTNHAVIFKTPEATGAEWAVQFPAGFSCGRCVRDAGDGLDAFEPTPCVLIVIEAVFDDPCRWY